MPFENSDFFYTDSSRKNPLTDYVVEALLDQRPPPGTENGWEPFFLSATSLTNAVVTSTTSDDVTVENICVTGPSTTTIFDSRDKWQRCSQRKNKKVKEKKQGILA
ncbi:hypothetical protein GHT06_013488 [Daphnia sinensis]|uniref:Uncharacterized protein n=1 Tax=Daphnia sinensis TaxID=1820382 RepID=A0AAD5KTX8_9CRUS|nr:hypothetical protein GHT06_013488 [Daphnia sinensis]